MIGLLTFPIPGSYDEQNRLWNLFRYEDVISTLADLATFSSRIMIPAPAQDSEESFLSSWLKGDITKMDPPQHRHFRGLALLLERFPSLKIQPGAELEAYESPFINGVKNLPVSW